MPSNGNYNLQEIFNCFLTADFMNFSKYLDKRFLRYLQWPPLINHPQHSLYSNNENPTLDIILCTYTYWKKIKLFLEFEKINCGKFSG